VSYDYCAFKVVFAQGIIGDAIVRLTVIQSLEIEPNDFNGQYRVPIIGKNLPFRFPKRYHELVVRVIDTNYVAFVNILAIPVLQASPLLEDERVVGERVVQVSIKWFDADESLILFVPNAESYLSHRGLHVFSAQAFNSDMGMTLPTGLSAPIFATDLQYGHLPL
jgi:hypothetical protein